MLDVSRLACGLSRRTVFAHPEFKARGLRTFLLTTVAGIVLTLGADRADADEFNWGGVTGHWSNPEKWDENVVPTASDTANFSSGDGSIESEHSIDTLNVSGAFLEINPDGVLNVTTLLDVTSGWFVGDGSFNVGDDGTITQSGGTVSGLHISTPSYTQSGGENTAFVTASTYNHAGGSMGGELIADTYNLTDASATSTNGSIEAAVLFALSPTSDTATVDAHLTGTGSLVKSGDSTVVLTNAANDFTGTVSIEAGTLEVVNDALPDDATVSIDSGATLAMKTFIEMAFMGTMSGEGSLTKEEDGILTLGGEVALGTLAVNYGTLEIGTGTSKNTASFGSVSIGEEGTLYIATGATLTVDAAGDLTNNGTLTNYGIVNDALKNTATVENYFEYNADIASNTGNIRNQASGVWTGDVISNDRNVNNFGSWIGQVSANEDAITNDGTDAVWTGDVATNQGEISNQNGASWIGDVLANGGSISNEGEDAVWTGDVAANSGRISNQDGAAWNGDVLGNTDTIYNRIDSTWTGNVVAMDEGTIQNFATWTGDVESNNGWLYQFSGAWEGDVLSNSRAILIMGGTWTGDIVTNDGGIVNIAGTWTGDVLDNKGTVDNDAGSIWIGDVTNNGGITNRGSWTGDVAGNTGVLFNNGSEAIWTGDVLASSNQISNQNGAAWNGDVLGNNNVIFNESGSTWTGDVVANGGGSNKLANIDNEATWIGDVKGNAVAIYNSFVWNGDVAANTGRILNLSGAWTGDVTTNAGTVSNRSGATWTGNVASNDGTIENRAGGTWTGAVLANDGIISNKGIWHGAFTNAGTVNAENRINGAFDNSGILNVTGSLAGITTLTNTGTIDMRGNGAAQTFSAANATFGPQSIYALDVNAAGNSDLIAVSGTAALGGSVRVAAATGTPYNESTIFTILTAGNIVGEFQSVTTDLAFLAPRLSYATNAVELTLLRNDVGFGSIGTTANQNTAGTAVQALGNGNELYDAVLWLNSDQAAQAFDALSGEAHNSVESTNVENASPLADMLIDRMDASLDVPMGGNARVASLDAGFVPSTPGQSAKFWGQVYGRQSSVGASSTAGSDSKSGGFAGGFDDAFGDWRLGLMLHLGRSRSDVSALSSSADSTDYGLGAYGGRKWGDTRLSLGASYTRHDISSERHIAFLGFTDKVSADYKSGTVQVFGKLSQRFNVETVSLSPYASLAYVRNDTDGFTETGGAAALSSADNHLDAVFTTLGLEAERKFRMGDTRLAARGKLGWRHIFADAPVASYRFANGADFTVSGAPIKGNAIVAGAGLDINEVSSLDVSYEGRVGGVEGHALMGTWAMRF